MKNTKTSNFAHSFEEIAAALALRTEEFISYLNLEGEYENSRRTFRTGDVYGNKGESMVINVESHGRHRQGTWYDFASSEKPSDLLELLYLNRGYQNKGQAVKEACEFLGVPVFKNQAAKQGYKPPIVAAKTEVEVKKPEKKILGSASEENLARHHNLLLKNEKALAYLERRGIDLATIKKFQLGLSQGYTNRDGLFREGFLRYPLKEADGAFKNKAGYIPIPDVSVSSDGKLTSFMATGGGTFAYFNRAITFETNILLIVEGHKDLWALDQFLTGTPYEHEFVLMTPCNGVMSTSHIPELHDEKFLRNFRKIFCLYDNDDAGDKGAEKLKEIIPSTPLYRIKVDNLEGQTGADITDFISRDSTIAQFEGLMRSAVDMRTDRVISASDSLDLSKASVGKYDYTPFDPNISFHNGMLHYPMTVHYVGYDEDTGEKYEMLTVGVIRSDRRELTLRKSKLPKGVDRSKAILRLSDGSIISEEPRPNDYATWEYSSAGTWMAGKYKIPDALSLYQRIKTHLAGSVYLPEPFDYTILALTVMATYIQPIFDAVPYILLNGAKGSGKSELGDALAKVGANSNQMSAMSAATLSREADRTSGLVILDDVEEIGSHGRASTAKHFLEQYLKLGYKKSSAIRKTTDMITGKPLNLNQFGIKVIGNTGGVVDEPLLQRMFIVKTKALPKDTNYKKKHLPPEVLKKLRQDLHAWAFEYVAELNSIYQSRYAHSTNREEEIAAPLHVIVSHIRSDDVKEELTQAMRIQELRRINDESPENMLEEACRTLVNQGYQDVLVKHVQLELKTLIDPLEGKDSKYDIANWDRLEWITKTLQQMDVAEPKKNGGSKERKMLNGQKHSVLRFTNSFMSSARKGLMEPIAIKSDARSFCMNQVCNSCAYVEDCDMTKRNNLNNKESAK